MKRLLALATCVMVMVIARPAFAATFSDPDDMAGPMDVRRLVHTQRGGDIHRFRVTTDGTWGCRYLKPKTNTMRWFFDGGGDGDVDLVGNVKCVKRGGGRDIQLFLRGKDSGNQYEPLGFTRPNRRTLNLTFSFDIPELNGNHVDLRIHTTDRTVDDCTSPNKCVDRAPDDGMWRLY